MKLLRNVRHLSSHHDNIRSRWIGTHKKEAVAVARQEKGKSKFGSALAKQKDTDYSRPKSMKRHGTRLPSVNTVLKFETLQSNQNASYRLLMFIM
jgi:hypothetical protein